MTEDELEEIDWIEKYHQGQLQGADLAAFLERRKNDMDFADKVKTYQIVIAGIRYYGKQKEFADAIGAWEEEIKDPSKKKQTETVKIVSAEPEKTFFIGRKSLYWLAAAVVSLVIVSYVFLLFQAGEPDTMALYNKYYQPYPNLFYPTVRGDMDGDTLSISKKAFLAYNQSDYHTAARYFKEALSHHDDIGNDYALLYLGNCLMALDSISEAKKALIQIPEKSTVADQAKWYLSLAHLKTHDLEDARNVLNELADHPNSYRDKANKIIQEINK